MSGAAAFQQFEQGMQVPTQVASDGASQMRINADLAEVPLPPRNKTKALLIKAGLRWGHTL